MTVISRLREHLGKVQLMPRLSSLVSGKIQAKCNSCHDRHLSSEGKLRHSVIDALIVTSRLGESFGLVQ